jgi:hypothetical protein
MRINYLIIFFSFLTIFSKSADGQIKEFFITCDPADFAHIYENYSEDIYVPIILVYKGIEWHDTYMRIRGDGSRHFPKKSLKIMFSGEPFINGRDRLNFNAEYEDKSYIRSYLATQVFKMAGQTCFSAEHIRLYLNGDFLGLYVMIENMDSKFLESHNYDPQGNLYKAAVDGACLSIYDDIENFWEQKTGSGNKEDLAQFIIDINEVSIDDYKDFCGQTMNYAQVVNIIACNMVTSNTSTYYHNYYMYRDAHGTGLWEMLPWDMDRSLSVNAWRNHTYSSPPWTSDNPYLEKAILNPEMMNDIRVRVNEIFQNFFTSDIFIPMIDSLVAVLEPSVAQDTTDDVPDVQEWLTRIQNEKYYVNGYPAQLNWYFDNVQSSFVAEPTPGISPPDITFKWTHSIDPNGLPVYYNFFLTTGSRFQPEQTQVFENIQDTFLTIENIAEGNYYWKVISYGDSEQEVESFDSRNPLTVKIMEAVPCVVSQNTTLFKGNSPYLVNCKVIVEPQAVLTIEEGVTIYFEKDAQLSIQGGFQVNGTKDLPVSLLPAYNGTSFDGLEFIDAQQNMQINYMILTDGVLYSNNANIALNHCELMVSNHFLPDSVSIIYHQSGCLEISNSKITGKNVSIGIISEFAQSVIIANSVVENHANSLVLISVQSGIIKNNQIGNITGDGVFVNDSDSISVDGNRIYNCGNGIVIGGGLVTSDDKIIIQKNLIVNCQTGISVINGCSVFVDRNTLYKNETGIKLAQVNPGLGGGQAFVVNSIFSYTLGLVFNTDEHSNYTVSYSICDNDFLEGEENLFGNPKFISAVNSDFQLQATSPCIDTGDPSGTYDPDGTRADMGAFYFNQDSYDIIFNEINFRSSPDFDTEDWVELYNVDTVTANISGWLFKDEKDDHIFIIPFGVEIAPGGYLVLCRNAAMFSEKHPDVTNFIGNFDFGLSSDGELIRLFNSSGVLINYVVYGTDFPWPPEANGEGSTLELKNPFLDNQIPESWCASANKGTPGVINSCYINTTPKENGLPFEATIFPNPAPDKVYLRINHFVGGNVYLKLFSSDGKHFFSTEKPLPGAGETLIELHPIKSKGVCLLLIEFVGNDDATYSTTLKFIAH